jgi:polyadenylate-binding protein
MIMLITDFHFMGENL